MAKVKEYSLIIPTLNEEKYLPRLLTSIEEQEYKGNYEVIVVDGGSEDTTLKVLSKYKKKIPNLKVIKTKKGISHQRNIGAEHAQYNIFIFLDADTELPPQFLSKLSEKDYDTQAFVALPLILPLRGTLGDHFFVIWAYTMFFFASFTKPIVAGMCLITTKANHKKIGGFNTSAMYAEDIDYGLRSIHNGAKYHLILDIYLFASTRRKKQIRRRKLSFVYMKWYYETARFGAITDESKYKYKFGDHK